MSFFTFLYDIRKIVLSLNTICCTDCFSYIMNIMIHYFIHSYIFWKHYPFYQGSNKHWTKKSFICWSRKSVISIWVKYLRQKINNVVDMLCLPVWELHLVSSLRQSKLIPTLSWCRTSSELPKDSVCRERWAEMKFVIVGWIFRTLTWN